jgi:AraC-like DNA-binding protein
MRRRAESGFTRKREGFAGQRAIVLPEKIIGSCRRNAQISNVFITDIGFYPKARFHYRVRPKGAGQAILIYCVAGKGWVQMGEKRYAVGQDSIIVIPAEMAHSYGAVEDDPWSIYWMHFTGGMANVFAATLSLQGSAYHRAISYSEERVRLFDGIYSILESGYSFDNLVYVNMSLWQLLASFGYPDIFQVPMKQEQKDAIDQVIDFMKKNLDRILHLKEMASFLNISQPHFSAIFKKKTGFPPLEYFNHIKIQKACQHLRFTDEPVKEIAHILGFEDPYYFSRLFTKIMGISPVHYRRRR